MGSNVPRAVVCDATGVEADLRAVDAIARAALAARRLGRPFTLRGASAELQALLALTGLAGALGVEPGRQPEQREDPLGVEEERHLPDAPA